MNPMRPLLLILLVLLYVVQWVTIAHQSLELDTRRIPEERLIELLEQSRLSEHRLAAVAKQNEVLTARTVVILERLALGTPPTVAAVPLAAPVIPTVHNKLDAPLVIYEAEPVKAPARKGKRL